VAVTTDAGFADIAKHDVDVALKSHEEDRLNADLLFQSKSTPLIVLPPGRGGGACAYQ
jgi:hypothetical protein